ncbi:hypothetical protein [uncultured Methanobrevibacter sp.]|uniref:hypothetical protein n=1 Tax=uncultured Methanobrevibacter sp. TaxID=253161 RepID=UPI00262C057A|nr:hypothetical protein [uncultured Methanobrevibacter sp.]
MKDYKIILISFVLLIFFIGAVSAADGENAVADNLGTSTSDDSIVVGDGDNDVKEIYVSTVGDDSNQGTKESPYANVSKAVSVVTDSDDATIYIGEGIFLLNENLDIDLDHEVGGNLEIIGAGADKTFLDGQSAFCFATIGINSNVKIKDITFINCKNPDGGVISNYGNLTVDNCIFKDSYVTNLGGGAIYSEGEIEDIEIVDDQPRVIIAAPNLRILNSQFISTYINSNNANSRGGAIYAVLADIYLENNTFINTRLSENGGQGAAVYIEDTPATIINNKFINITGTQDASIFLLNPTDAPFMFDESVITGNEFINCSCPSDTYSIVNLYQGAFKLENNVFVNSTNSVGNIYAGYSEISGLKFAMNYTIYNVSNYEASKGFELNKITVTDDMGNIVIKSSIDVNLSSDENSISKTVRPSNGVATFTFDSVPVDGIYNLTLSSGDATSDVLGIVNVSLNNDPVELWVSPNGLDANNGTLDSPFATIQHAIDVGFENSFTVVIHLLKGTYTKEGNVQLTIANQGNLQILGEKYNETIIDGEGTSWFLAVSTTNVNVTNVSFVNGYGNRKDLISGKNKLFLDNCIIDNNDLSNTGRYYILVNTLFDRLVYTNNGGRISVPGKITITGSYFANNVYKNSQSNGIINTAGATFIDCKFINNTNAQNGGAITGYFTSINNYYENNSPIEGGAGGAVYLTGDSTFINDTFVNNHAEQGGAFSVFIDYDSLSRSPKLTFDNCKFINNTASNGGAGYLNFGKFTDCSFINNSADYGGALYLAPYIKDAETPDWENCTFENNIMQKVNDVYLELPTDWWIDEEEIELAYAIPLTITFNSQNVTSLVDDLTATVYGPSGAVIGAKYLTFELNGTKIGSPEVVGSVVTFNYAGFEEGDYILNGAMEYPNNENVINSGLISVKLENILDHVEMWVSLKGSDENGNGSESNPFKSISKAIKEAVKNCRDITINIVEGIYTGDLNTGLTITSLSNVTLVGEGIDKTIIDGENATVFAKITEGNNKVTLKDLTIQNMMPANVEEFMAGNKNVNNLLRKLDPLACPITVDEGATLCLDGVRITSCRGGPAIIRNNGKLNVENSLFNNNGISSHGIIYGGNVSIDDTEISSNVAAIGILYDIPSLVVNNSLIKNNFNLAYFSLTGSSGYSSDAVTIIENTVISNDGDNSSLSVIGYNDTCSILSPAFCLANNVLANNISMINSFGSPLPEYNLISSSGSFLSAFGLIYGSGGRTVSASNSTFINLTNLWSVNTYGTVMFSFDGCLFDGITMIAKSLTPGDGSQYNITNSVFVNTDLVIDRNYRSDREDPNCTFENNYWGSNDKPAIRFVNTGQGRATSFEPETWITLYSEDEQTVIKNVTDGENSTAYLGNAPIRTDYADNKGALDYAVVFGPVGYLFTTDDDNNVIFNQSEPIYPFVAADPMDYRTSTEIVLNGFEGDLGVIFVLVDIVGNPIANATITSTFGDLAPVNTTTDANGTFKVKAGKNGVLKVVFAGDDTYFDTEGNLTFANAGKTAKTFINFNEVEGDFAITGVLVDDEGTPIANAAIKAIINSNTTVNTTTDDKGAFKVQGLSNCVIDVIFAGDDVYNPSNATITLNNLAPIRAATVIEGNNYTQNAIEYKLGERGGNFTVQLKDASGKPLANKTVLIGYNGKCLERTTDENGYANVQINLASENRLTFAVAFLGDDEYNATMSVYLITITKKPVTISAPDKTYKASAKTKSYTVTLSTVKGVDGKTYFGAGKKVTLKVDGKTYTAKTNDKGQATFKLNMAKKGTFKATVSYAGDGTYQAATKTSKIKIN